MTKTQMHPCELQRFRDSADRELKGNHFSKFTVTGTKREILGILDLAECSQAKFVNHGLIRGGPKSRRDPSEQALLTRIQIMREQIKKQA